jgi:hypothetical protein
MLTEKDYCDYETCVALKELGYVGSRQECEYFGAYFNFGKDMFTDSLDNTEVGTNEYLRVPLYLAQKWLREEKDIHIEIPIWLTDNGVWKYNFRLQTREFYDRAIGEWDTYEEALLEGIKEAVKILKEK